jgi:hypothetical protein
MCCALLLAHGPGTADWWCSKQAGLARHAGIVVMAGGHGVAMTIRPPTS